MKGTLLVFFIGFATLAFAQKLRYENFEWEESPALHTLSEAEQKESALILRDERVVEYDYTDDDDLISYYTVHKIIRVNDATSVEDYNKFLSQYLAR